MTSPSEPNPWASTMCDEERWAREPEDLCVDCGEPAQQPVGMLHFERCVSCAEKREAEDALEVETFASTTVGLGEDEPEEDGACPWCGGPFPCSADECPTCGATVKEDDDG